MSRQTLAQRKGLAAYRDMVRDTRAPEQRHAQARAKLAYSPITPITQPVPKPVPAWITWPLVGVALVAVSYAVFRFATWFLPIVWSMP